MKNILYYFTFVLFFILTKSFAQFAIQTDTIKKAGIYKTFEEFRDNNPSLKADFNRTGFKIVSDDFKYKSKGENEKFQAYGLEMPFKMSQNIGFIFGFCDGKNVYVSTETQQFPNYIAFYKISNFGKICYYDAFSSSLLGVVNNGPKNINLPINMSDMQRKVITQTVNLETGEYKKLSIKFIKKLLVDHPTLQEKFELEKDKKFFLKEYLEEYNNL